MATDMICAVTRRSMCHFVIHAVRTKEALPDSRIGRYREVPYV
jgi:hypothetical protein